MARYGLIADVHGNLQALQAVLDALAVEDVEQVLCLGDLVGYNAAANECVALLRERGAVCVAGDHDLMALGQLGFERCAARPEFSLRRTRRDLWAESRSFLESLPDARLVDGQLALTHAGVNDVSQYLHPAGDVAANASRLRARFPQARICFFGHTHVPAIHEQQGGRFHSRTLLVANRLHPDRLTFVNPGSVDAARRVNKQAELALFDSDSWTVWLRRVPYDHQSAERAARLEGYRMTPVDATVMAGRRFMRRVGRKAAGLVGAGSLRPGASAAPGSERAWPGPEARTPEGR